MRSSPPTVSQDEGGDVDGVAYSMFAPVPGLPAADPAAICGTQMFQAHDPFP